MSASATTGPGTPSLHVAQPQAFTSDFERAVRFYRDRLGFRVEFQYGDPPFYGLVSRGEARLNLRHVDDPVFDDGQRTSEDLLTATIAVDGVKALFREYREREVEMHQNLKREEWGLLGFIVRDPDGNLLAFHAPTPDE